MLTESRVLMCSERLALDEQSRMWHQPQGRVDRGSPELLAELEAPHAHAPWRIRTTPNRNPGWSKKISRPSDVIASTHP